MKRFLLSVACFLAMMPVLCSGQVGAIARGAKPLYEQLLTKGGKTAVVELAEIGGERGVQQVLDLAIAQGGQPLASAIARESLVYGPAVIRAARPAPLQFMSAFERLPPALRSGALQEIDRNADLMKRLIGTYGTPALEAGARHPGVGPQVLSTIGKESEGFLARQPTDNVIRLGRIADDVVKHPAPQRAELLALIEKAPDKMFKLLQNNPKVLATGAALTAFLASKDQLLGTSEVVIGPDGTPSVLRKPGLIENVSAHVTAMLEKPILIIAIAIAVLLLAWGSMTLVGAMRSRAL